MGLRGWSRAAGGKILASHCSGRKEEAARSRGVRVPVSMEEGEGVRHGALSLEREGGEQEVGEEEEGGRKPGSSRCQAGELKAAGQQVGQGADFSSQSELTSPQSPIISTDN